MNTFTEIVCPNCLYGFQSNLNDHPEAVPIHFCCPSCSKIFIITKDASGNIITSYDCAKNKTLHKWREEAKEGYILYRSCKLCKRLETKKQTKQKTLFLKEASTKV